MDSQNKQVIKDDMEGARQTIRFFETLLRASTDGIVITDITQNIIIVNEAFCSFFGKAKICFNDEILNKSPIVENKNLNCFLFFLIKINLLLISLLCYEIIELII